MQFSDKEIRIFRGISMAAGIFVLVVAITMIFSLVQLKTLDPVNSPSLQSVKDQFDTDPDSKDMAEQVRAIDLMARKAYFSSRWQVETGSYLLLAGAFIFVLFQRFVAGSEKPSRNLRPDKPDIVTDQKNTRKYILIAGGSVALLAVISSFVLRNELPAPGTNSIAGEPTGKAAAAAEANLPDPANWPFFRGEGSHGIAGGKEYPTSWDGQAGKNVKWKLVIPKEGKNSPVIWGDKIFLTGAQSNVLEVYCIDKNQGTILWTGSGSGYPGSSEVVPESDVEAGMAVPTAAVNKDYVCAAFGNGNLVCFDHDGKFQWGKNLGVPEGTYGFSASLLIYENTLLVQYDSQNKITISGYDLKSGDQEWETPRPGRPVNSSPVLATFDGEPQVLINGNPNVSAYDPVTGKELWTQQGVSGDVAPSLAVNSRLVYAAVDYYSIVALKPGNSGSPVWQDNTFTPDVSSPAANDKFLFVSTGNGDVACYDAEKGDTLWSHYFYEPFYSSPVIAGGNVYFLDRSGNMHIVREAPEFELVSESPVGELTDATPAFADKEIFIRAKDNLFCISGD
jgi:outer membrane protein assembly factor BamB